MKVYNCINCGKENKFGYGKVNKYCDNKCQGEHRNKLWYIENQPLFEQGLLKSRSAIKRFVTLRDGYKCALGIANAAKTKDGDFYQNKLALAAYFAQRILPEIDLRIAKVKAGAEVIMNFSEDYFTSQA